MYVAVFVMAVFISCAPPTHPSLLQHEKLQFDRLVNTFSSAVSKFQTLQQVRGGGGGGGCFSQTLQQVMQKLFPALGPMSVLPYVNYEWVWL